MNVNKIINTSLFSNVFGLRHLQEYIPLTKGQRAFACDDSLQLNQAPSVAMTTKEKVLNAEINQSFCSSNGDGERFRKMFPDSVIASTYNHQETKTKTKTLRKVK